MTDLSDNWDSANAYEAFMGRWSRRLALAYVRWLNPLPRLRWLDLGCGTGALTSALLALAEPSSVLACDPAGPFLAVARERISDPRVTFVRATAADLPSLPAPLQGFVSGLALNFIPDPQAAFRAILPNLAPAAVVGAYIWDYADRMQFLRAFWDSALAVDPAAVQHDEGRRFELCHPASLRSFFENLGLQNVRVEPVEITTRFENFADYWQPFLGGTGAGPAYLRTLSAEVHQALMEDLRARLLPRGDAAFELVARAWAVSAST